MLKPAVLQTLLLSLLFLCTVKYLPAQEVKDYNFTHYTKAVGIISHQVNTITQDHEGYMWLGTTNGLQRFDGIRFKTFTHIEDDNTSIPSNPVWQVITDKKNNLWLLMADGKVGVFNTKKFVFTQYPAKFKNPPSPNTSLKKLVTDEYGHLFYVITGSEVITWDEAAQEFSYQHNFFKQQATWQLSDFVQQPGTKNYWMGIANGGLAVYNAATGNLSYAENNTENISIINQHDKHAIYNNLFFDNKHRLWTSSPANVPVIHCYNIDSNKFIINSLQLSPPSKSYHEIKNFFQQKDGSVWAYGLHLFAKFLEDKKAFQFVYNGYQYSHSIAYEMLHCLYEDREKNTWVCTDNNSLYRFNPGMELFANIPHINRNSGAPGEGAVTSFVYTKWGTILSGTWNDGLYEYDSNLNALPFKVKGLDQKTASSVWCLTASRDNNKIWLGTNDGFYMLDQNDKSVKFESPSALKNNVVRQITEDYNGNIWVGTQNKGILKLTVTGLKNSVPGSVSAVECIPPVQINKIMVDKKNRVWIGTPENGLYVLDAASGKLLMHFGDQEAAGRKLPERGISSVLEYNDSIVIITTATRVVRYNVTNNQLTLIGKPDFVSGFITAVEKDKDGYLWLTSTSGLYHINMAKRLFIQYEREDGIDNDHFTQSASYQLPDGRILFGTTNNMVAFNPHKMQQSALYPDLFITDIKVLNKALNVDSVLSLPEMELSYKENSVIIELSQLTYNSANVIKYRMDKLEKEWNYAEKNNQAVYNYLPPGRYHFLVATMDDNGNESEVKSLLVIKVNSPFWKSWWFYSLLILSAGALLFWLDRQRMARKEAIQQMRTEIGKDLHQEVNTALSNITILSEMASMKTDTEPEKSKEFIEQIQSRSRNMMTSLDDMLWVINPENDSTEKMMLRLKEFIEALKSKHNVQVYLLVDNKAESLKLDMKQRKEIFWLFRGGIGNVVKCGADNCRLFITYEKPFLIYTLEFDTANVDMQQLTNLRQRTELTEKLNKLKAVLDVENHKMSTVFILKIPVL